jgi:hypothetical protein
MCHLPVEILQAVTLSIFHLSLALKSQLCHDTTGSSVETLIVPIEAGETDGAGAAMRELR